MNRIQRIAAAGAIGAAVLAPATGAALAVAKPDPGPPLQTRIEPSSVSSSDATSVPWDAIGLAAAAGAAVTAGTMAVVRHTRKETEPA